MPTLSSCSNASVWQLSSGLSSLSSGIKGHQMSLRLEFSGVSSGLRMCTITSSLGDGVKGQKDSSSTFPDYTLDLHVSYWKYFKCSKRVAPIAFSLSSLIIRNNYCCRSRILYFVVLAGELPDEHVADFIHTAQKGGVKMGESQVCDGPGETLQQRALCRVQPQDPYHIVIVGTCQHTVEAQVKTTPSLNRDS